MAIAWVQTSGSPTGEGTASATTTFSGANTLGNLLVVAANSFVANGAINTPTDTAGNTWHMAFDQADNGTTDGQLKLFYAWNCKSAAANNIVTVTSTSGTNDINNLLAVEYSGVQNTSDPLDASNGNFSTTGGASTIALTTHATGELLIGFVISDSGQSTTGATTPNSRSTANFTIYEDGIFSGSGGVNVTSGPTDPNSFNGLAVSFKASGAATTVQLWRARLRPIGL